MFEKITSKYSRLSPVLKAGLWFTICNFLQKGIGLITTPIFTRIMSTDEYGIYSIYLSWYDILTIFATLHLSYYVFNKGLIKYENDRDRFSVSIQSLSFSVTAGIFVLYLFLSNIVNRWTGLTTSMMMCMFIQLFFEPPILYWTARKRFEYKYQAVVIVTLSISILNPCLGVLLIKTGAFYNSVIARTISISVITAAFGIAFGFLIIKKARVPFSSTYWKYALGFNLPLIPHYLSTTILNQADRIMIGQMCGESDAALYSVAYAIGMACTLLSQAAQQAYLPWLYKKIKAQDTNGINKVTSCFLVGILAILLILICFAPEIIVIIGTKKYYNAIWVIPPLCGSVFFIFLQNLFANVEYYYEKTRLIAAASVGVAVLNVFLNYIFIELFGFVAAGYTTLFCYIVFSITHYFVMKSICKKNKLSIKDLFDLKFVFMLSILTLCVVLVMTFVYKSFIARYSIIVVIGVFGVVFRKKILQIVSMLKRNKQ